MKDKPSLDAILNDALNIEDPAERSAYLEEVCGGDVGLRGEVESLLAAHFGAKGFMETLVHPEWEAIVKGGKDDTMPTAEELVNDFPELESIELIGRGGMGAVFKARQASLDRFVALKVLPRGWNSSGKFSERFEREAKILAGLNHPGIVTIHEFGERHGRYFFTMEFVDGTDLGRMIQGGELEPDAVLKLISQICDAIQFAHDQGVVHRDIKPGNILLNRDGRVKVADFGIAKLGSNPGFTGTPDDQREKQADLTAPDGIVGTPRYMAPEQASASTKVDHRADLYALGMVFYEMLIGSPPPEGALPVTTSRNGKLDRRWDQVIRRALEKDPNRRYQNASEIRTAVELVLSGNKRVLPIWLRTVAAMVVLSGVGTLFAFWPKSAPEKEGHQVNSIEIPFVPIPVVETKPRFAPYPGIDANTNFAFDLYRQLAEENEGENLFFSPFSVFSGLAMTAEGARGRTALQMGEVLRYPKWTATNDSVKPWDMEPIHFGMAALNSLFDGGNKFETAAEAKAKITMIGKQLDEVHREIKTALEMRDSGSLVDLDERQSKLIRDLHAAQAPVNQYDLKFANALWVEKSYPFKDDYLEKIGKFYGTGGAFLANFKDTPGRVDRQIKSWIEELTKEPTGDLIPNDRVVSLVLVNAASFEGDWLTPFKVKNTKIRDFTLTDGRTVRVPIMNAPALEEASYAAFNGDGSLFKTPLEIQNTASIPESYSGKNGFAMLELSYMGNELSMLIIAPNDPGQLAAVEEKLTPENLAAWVFKLKQRKVQVFLPEFKVETDYILGDAEKPAALQKMGMTQAFVDPCTPKGADFDGMSNALKPEDKLYLATVLHKVLIEVNEKRTSADTEGAGLAHAYRSDFSLSKPTPADVSDPLTLTFKADRPFFYLIRDRLTGSILFMGRMMNPTD